MMQSLNIMGDFLEIRLVCYGRTDGPTDQRTDKASYRDAWTHLKMKEGKRKEQIGKRKKKKEKKNKAGYTATPVACGWAGAVIEVTRSFGQEQ